MRRVFVLLLACLVFGLWSCSPISVRTDYDHEVDFSYYQTFKWMPVPKKKSRKTIRKGSLLDKRIRRAVERELEAKGFEVKSSGRADALLAYHVVVSKHVDVERYGYWGRRVYVRRYKEGTIIIDIVDPQEKQLIWRGAAQGLAARPDTSEEKINEAMAKLFEKYPPKE